MKAYQIVKSGLYSCGGARPIFRNKGKVWANMAGLKNHIRLADDAYMRMEGDAYIEEIECECVTSSGKIYGETSRVTLITTVSSIIKELEQADERKKREARFKQEKAYFLYLKEKNNW